MKKDTKSHLIIVIVAALVVTLAIAITSYSTGGTARKLKNQLAVGQEYLNNLDYEQAAAAFRKALQIDPNSKEAKERLEETYVAWTDSYLKQGDYETALNILSEGGTVLPDSERLLGIQTNAYLAWADYFASNKDYDNAVQILEEGSGKTNDQRLIDKSEEYKSRQEQLKVNEDSKDSKEVEEQSGVSNQGEANEQEELDEQKDDAVNTEDIDEPASASNVIELTNYLGKSYEEIKTAFPGGSENRGVFTWTGEDIEYYHQANDNYLDWDFFVGKLDSNDNYVNDGIIHGVRFSAQHSAIPASGAIYGIAGVTPDMSYGTAHKILLSSGWTYTNTEHLSDEYGGEYTDYTYRKGEFELVFEESVDKFWRKRHVHDFTGLS